MADAQTLRPDSEDALRDVVDDAVRSGQPLRIGAGGSKQEIGRPLGDARHVDLCALSGVVAYEPSELVLTVRPATPLIDIEAMLDAQGQMLAFDPWDHGPVFGRAVGATTIGGIVAAGVAGPRRVSAGGVRDHLLGLTAISGRGEVFRAGGKVVKNVTGYDLPKVIAGSWGQLAILTELTLKVVPRPRATATIALHGLSAGQAVAAMAKAMGSRCSVAAASHLPATPGVAATTMLRMEGFSESVEVRASELQAILAEYGDSARLAPEVAAATWAGVCEALPLAEAETLWRAHAAPSAAENFIAAIEAAGGSWLCDWAGALLWVGGPAGIDVHAIARANGGHAMLLRAPSDMRHALPVRTPEPPAVAALAARVKQAFDPAGILDPYRFS